MSDCSLKVRFGDGSPQKPLVEIYKDKECKTEVKQDTCPSFNLDPFSDKVTLSNGDSYRPFPLKKGTSDFCNWLGAQAVKLGLFAANPPMTQEQKNQAEKYLTE